MEREVLLYSSGVKLHDLKIELECVEDGRIETKGADVHENVNQVAQMHGVKSIYNSSPPPSKNSLI